MWPCLRSVPTHGCPFENGIAHRSLLIKGETIIINVPRDFVNCALLISEIPSLINNNN